VEGAPAAATADGNGPDLLLGILSEYVDYYNGTRTHLSLAKDAPRSRSVQLPSQGRVVKVPRVGGLHHEYLRRAA